MKSRIISILLSTALIASVIAGCGNSNVDNSTEATTQDEQVAGMSRTESDSVESDSAESADPYEAFIANLHAGQSYAYAPICEGENALLVTSYTVDFDGHQGTYEATIYTKKDNAVEKVTTVQSGGTAYPIVLTDDNCLILQMRNSIAKGYVSKDTGKFVITAESNVDYSNAEDGNYHNYMEGVADVPADSSIFDELSEKYNSSEVVSFKKAGELSDGTPHLAGGVYAAYNDDDLYKVTSYYVFEDETSGRTETPDGVSGLPFNYELSTDSIVFSFGSADEKSEAKFSWDNDSFPTITFAEGNQITLSCLGNADPATFEATKYYDNDNNLFMQVTDFDDTSFTGDLYREERIKAEYVDKADKDSILYSINGTQFSVISFEEVNAEIGYGTDAEFKKDVLGQTRFDKFLVKCSTDNFYYALAKEDYEDEYKVVSMMTDEQLRKLIDENVTFKIKDNCEIYILKFVEDAAENHIQQEYVVGREFKKDNYPGWSENAHDYYLTTGMLMALGVIDGELYNAVQVYVP